MHEGPVNFEPGFNFSAEGGDYVLYTESLETHEGIKYGMSIRGRESAANVTPLFGYAGLNAEELKEVVNFSREVTKEGLSIEDMIKKVQDHIIEKHSNPSEK